LRELIDGTAYGPLDGHHYEHGWTGDYLSACLHSDLGKRRQNNEDSCLLCVPEDTELLGRLGMMFAVADGMGGATAGEYASRMALNVLAQRYYEGDGDGPAPRALAAALKQANLEVFEEAEVNPVLSGMGTTVSALVVVGDWAYIAQVGDSRVHQHRPGAGLLQVTRDHSLVAEQVRNGLISEEEAETHSLKNLITRAVGIKTVVEVDLFAVRLEVGDTLLLCSDGLSNMVSDAAIAEILAGRDLKHATDRLVQDALDAGGTDNITALTVRVIAPPVPCERQDGAELVTLGPPPGFWARIRRALGAG